MPKSGERIARRRIELGMSQDELAKAVGYSTRSAINKIEAGVNDVRQSKVKLFADALKTTVGYIMGDEDSFSNVTPVQSQRVPVLGSISCGDLILADTSTEGFASTVNMDADFGLYAKGDSMINARIHDGDLVLCRSQEVVENGQIAVVIIDDEATLKRFFFYPDSELVILRPENPKYREQIYHGSEIGNIRVIGRAIGVQFPI